jgi:hypothetical protein
VHTGAVLGPSRVEGTSSALNDPVDTPVPPIDHIGSAHDTAHAVAKALGAVFALTVAEVDKIGGH